jgi:hypothetical protein
MFKVVLGGNTVRSAVFGPLCVGLFSALIGVTLATPSVAASVTGYAVKAVTGPANDDPAGVLEFRPLLGGNAIKYFIPLNSGTSGTFGNSGACGSGGYGTCSDTGSTSGTLTMNLRFDGVGLGSAVLKVVFEDLDLIGVGDPSGFLESVNVLNAAGTTLSGGPITDIASILVDGNADVQTLVLNLLLTGDPTFLKLKFKSFPSFNGTNTAEYLIATITPVPLPAAIWMMGSLLFGWLGFSGWRRRSQQLA